jgi:hypothetical protein
VQSRKALNTRKKLPEKTLSFDPWTSVGRRVLTIAEEAVRRVDL